MAKDRSKLYFVNTSNDIIKTDLRNLKSQTIRARKLTNKVDDKVTEICRYNSRIYALMASNQIVVMNIEQSKILTNRKLRENDTLTRMRIASNRNMVVLVGKFRETPQDVEDMFLIELLSPHLNELAILQVNFPRVPKKESPSPHHLLLHSACPLDPSQPSLAIISFGDCIRLFCLNISTKSITVLHSLEISARGMKLRGNNLYIACTNSSVKRITLNLN